VRGAGARLGHGVAQLDVIALVRRIQLSAPTPPARHAPARLSGWAGRPAGRPAGGRVGAGPHQGMVEGGLSLASLDALLREPLLTLLREESVPVRPKLLALLPRAPPRAPRPALSAPRPAPRGARQPASDPSPSHVGRVARCGAGRGATSLRRWMKASSAARHAPSGS
jgi:hypothetical protein